MEKLIIKNFGPIKSVELKLGRFTVLVGEQSTGKSTIVKVLAVCRYFSYIVGNKGILRQVDGKYYAEVTIDIPFVDGLEDWGISKLRRNDTYISYSCKHYEIVFDVIQLKSNQSLQITPFSDEFKQLLQELQAINPDQYAQQVSGYRHSKSEKSIAIPVANIPYSFYKNNVAEVMDNPFYLPAERSLQSLFSLGKSSVSNLSNFLYNYFARFEDEIATNFTTDTLIEPLALYYQNISGKGHLRQQGTIESFGLSEAASGYQSTIPVVLAIKYYSEHKKKMKTFLVEEPELNLFPSAQNELTKYMVEMSNAFSHNFLVTTHSPYVLTSLNNMMFAFQVGKLENEEICKIIGRKFWLNSEDVAAFLLKSDGTAENIIDDESMQIKAEKIDEISRKFNEEYDQMLSVKYAINER